MACPLCLIIYHLDLISPSLSFQRRQWHPTPVLLPGKSHGQRSLVGCGLGVARSQTRVSNFTFTFHFHALEKEMAIHSSVFAWRIPGTREPGGLPSMGLHRVGHDWSDLAATAVCPLLFLPEVPLSFRSNDLNAMYDFAHDLTPIFSSIREVVIPTWVARITHINSLALDLAQSSALKTDTVFDNYSCYDYCCCLTWMQIFKLYWWNCTYTYAYTRLSI